MQDNEQFLFLKTLAVVLCTAAVTTIVFQRLRQPVVLGYMLAGMIVGPYVAIPLTADVNIVGTLSELGVILLMFSLGTEFSLQKLRRVGPKASLIAILQCSFMLWTGYLVGQAFGWHWLPSLFAGAMISISSTTIIIKAFGEQHVKGEFTDLVMGVLIVEDLIAILLITILTTLSDGGDLSLAELGVAAGRLFGFLAALVIAGLLIVPRLMRYVVRLDKPETTVVAAVGLAFGVALLAMYFHYSVALGAFIAGSLVAESGVARRVEHLVQPVRDMFAAIFFVSVGMLIDPSMIAAHPGVSLAYLVVVVCGMILSVTLGAILTGHSVQTSVRTGMSMAQIGEFSFIIASLGMLNEEASDTPLYAIAVAVSAVTTLLTPWFIRWAEPVAKLVDRKLPRPLQTFVALYGSWIEHMRSDKQDAVEISRTRRLVRWLAVDAVVVAAIVIGASVELNSIGEFLESRLQISSRSATFAVLGGAILASAPFWIGMIRTTRFLGQELANRAFPAVGAGALDTADAPRRLLVVTLQLLIVMVVGAPLVAVTQPFVPALQGALILFLFAGLLAISFWRNATNLQGHARAAAHVVAELLAQQSREGEAVIAQKTSTELEGVLVGLGSPERVTLPADSPAVGKTLAQINLRGLTGATVLAVVRGEETVLVPVGKETLLAGDVLALAGSKESIEAATELLHGTRGEHEIAAIG
ncbi:MAG TPA: cation:proton antiporter [Pirellulales bacterium]|jgi:CPA2 family monovalent cation:H+ antiporter-2